MWVGSMFAILYAGYIQHFFYTWPSESVNQSIKLSHTFYLEVYQ